MKKRVEPPPADPVAAFAAALDGLLDGMETALASVTDPTTPNAQRLKQTATLRLAAFDVGVVVASALRGDRDAATLVRRMHALSRPALARSHGDEVTKDDRSARAVAVVQKHMPLVLGAVDRRAAIDLFAIALASLVDGELIDRFADDDEQAWLFAVFEKKLTAASVLAKIVARYRDLRLLGHSRARSEDAIRRALKRAVQRSVR